MKCSTQDIDAGNAAVSAERNRLQLSDGRTQTEARIDPFLCAPPKSLKAPGPVEMLNEGLREMDAERGEK